MDLNGVAPKPPQLVDLPLIIHGKSYVAQTDERSYVMPDSTRFRGADVKSCLAALDSSTAAFEEWSQSSPNLRRQLLLTLADVCMHSPIRIT
jgi:acyl-CoA reductase-like NAD-dependent aldehyde dehydrogenase